MTVRVDSRDDGQDQSPAGQASVGDLLAGNLVRLRDVRLSRAVASRLLLAFLLAVALWTYVTAQQNPVRTVSIAGIPIVPVGLPAGYVINPPLGTVAVQVQGLDSDLRGVSSSDVQALVDARSLAAGSTVKHLPITIKLPGGHRLTLLEYTPKSVAVSADVTARKTVAVTVVSTGQTPAGYLTGTPQVNPAVVTVSGLRSTLDHIQGATVEVNLSNIIAPLGDNSGFVKESLAPIFVDASGNQISPQPSSVSPPLVTVSIAVHQQIAFSTMPVVASIVGAPRPGYYLSGITVSPPSVTVFGDPSVIATLQAISTEDVDVTGITTTTTMATTLRPRPNVGLSNANQPVTVTVQVQPIVVQTDLSLPVTIQGLPAGWTASLNPAIITLQVSGPALVLADVALFHAVADVTGLSAGKHHVVLNLTLPPEVRLLASVAPGAEVTLTAPVSQAPPSTTTSTTPVARSSGGRL